MRKRILSIVLVLALCLAYIPAVPKVYAATVTLSDYVTAADAFTAAGNGGTVVVSSNFTQDELSVDVIGAEITIVLQNNATFQVTDLETNASLIITGTGTFAVTGNLLLTLEDTSLTLLGGPTYNIGSILANDDNNSLFLKQGANVSITYLGFEGINQNIGFWDASTLTVTGTCILSDDISFIFEDNDSSFVIADLTQLATPGDTAVLGATLENYMRKRYSFDAGLDIKDKTSALDPSSLTLRNWVAQDTSIISFANTTYNGEPQDLVEVGDYDATAVDTILYGISTDDVLTGTTPQTQTNAGTYTNLAFLVVGKGNYDDYYATGDATIAAATVPFFTALPRAIQVGNAMPSLAAPAEGTDYTVKGLISPSDLLSVEMAYVGAPANTDTAGEWFDAIQFTNIVLAVPGNYNGNPVASSNSGTLTITDDPPVSMTAAPQGINDLVYNGSDQVLAVAGTAEGGTMMYSTDAGTTWSDALPTGKDATTYEILFRIEPDAGYSAVDAFSGEFDVDILRAPAIIVEANEHATMTAGSAMPALYTANGAKGTDSLDVNIFWPAGDPDTTVAGGPYDFEVNVTGFASGTMDNYEPPYYEVMVPMGQLTVTSGGGGGGGDTTPKESYNFVQPEEGPGSGIMDDENWTWGERGNMTEDMGTLYKFLSNNAISAEEDSDLPYPDLGTDHFLVSESTWTLPDENPDVPDTPVNQALVCQDNEPIYLANGDGKVDQSTFGNSDFYIVGVGTGDSKIDYPNLKTGDVVSNKTFNGVFVTKLQKSNNPTFDSDLARLKSETIASFRAFELDHPEVFWLNGSIKLRVLTVTISGEQTSFLFMTLVDDGGFTMRIAEYAEKGAIEKGIAQRDAAVAAIIAQIPAGASDREKVVNLNKWFTLNNEYNRSADLSAIGYTPHRSLKSLTGNFGINGPVCDGYSRGFKTVCDRLGIPVVLETGTASIGSHSELHMWMSIKIDGTWYGTDTTWNDPIVKGKDGKVSGYENEKYLLVGNDTVVDGAKFGVSHPANKTPGGTTGVLFASLILNPNEIYGYVPVDYEDVHTSDWFYDYVQDVTKLNLMNGTSPNLFSPQGTATRGQIVQILYNIAGQPEVDEVKVDGWFGVPGTWAMDKGIVAGYADGDFHGNDPVTREQLATILWAFEGAPEQSGTLSFADADKVSSYAVQALLWAKKKGIIGGKPGNLVDPQGTATRAEIATIFSNYMK